jgi:hypothetical protein
VEVGLAALGAVLTVLIFSYLLGDNPLYRLALHVFVGASVAYICIVALYGVLVPALTLPDSGDADAQLLWIVSLIGAVLGALLLTRGIQGISWLGDIPLSVLLGVGVGVALGGALLGTLVPQVNAATNPVVPETSVAAEIFEPLGQVVAVIGTATGLMVFSFVSRRRAGGFVNRLMNGGTRVGRWFVLIGFGAAFGGVLVASLAFFADRVQYLVEVVGKINGG